MSASDTERRALDLFVKLLRATNAVTSRTEPSILALGLTVTQFGVLEALFHKGPMTHGVLRRKVLTSPGNLTDVIDKLQARGLVTRCRESGDGRQVRLGLTEAGRALVACGFPPHAAAITAAVSGLGPEEQAVLAGLLRKLGLTALSPAAGMDFFSG